MNSRDLMKSFSELDEELIERSESIMKKRSAARTALNEEEAAVRPEVILVDETVSKKARPRIWRYIGAAAAALLMAGALFGITRIVGIGESPKLPTEPASQGEAQPAEKTPSEYAFLYDTSVPEDAVLPPNQEGSKGMGIRAGLDKLRDWKEIYEDSDAVCIVTIRDWLGENELYSYYNATVERTYKGELPETIVVYQPGNSSYLCDDAPLFTYGDKLLLGIRRWEDRPFENAYYVTDNVLAFTYISVSKDGDPYVIDSCGVITHYTGVNLPELHFTKYGENKKLAKELFEEIGEYDSVIAAYFDERFSDYYEHRKEYHEGLAMIPSIYSLAQIEDFFAGLE